MLDAATSALLQTVLRRESLSVLQYAGEAFPWASSEELKAVSQIRQLWEEDRALIGELTRLLYKKRVRPPFIGAFPTAFTTLNFIGVDYILARLVEDQKRAVADLERDAAAAADPDARELLEKFLALKKKHLPILEGLASQRSQPAA